MQQIFLLIATISYDTWHLHVLWIFVIDLTVTQCAFICNNCLNDTINSGISSLCGMFDRILCNLANKHARVYDIFPHYNTMLPPPPPLLPPLPPNLINVSFMYGNSTTEARCIFLCFHNIVWICTYTYKFVIHSAVVDLVFYIEFKFNIYKSMGEVEKKC